MISSSINSGIKGYCSSTASEDVASGLNVFSFYCAAARNEVKATVAESSTDAP